MHHLENYEKNYSIYTECDRKVIPRRILQNLKKNDLKFLDET